MGQWSSTEALISEDQEYHTFVFLIKGGKATEQECGDLHLKEHLLGQAIRKHLSAIDFREGYVIEGATGRNAAVVALTFAGGMAAKESLRRSIKSRDWAIESREIIESEAELVAREYSISRKIPPEMIALDNLFSSEVSRTLSQNCRDGELSNFSKFHTVSVDQIYVWPGSLADRALFSVPAVLESRNVKNVDFKYASDDGVYSLKAQWFYVPLENETIPSPETIVSNMQFWIDFADRSDSPLEVSFYPLALDGFVAKFSRQVSLKDLSDFHKSEKSKPLEIDQDNNAYNRFCARIARAMRGDESAGPVLLTDVWVLVGYSSGFCEQSLDLFPSTVGLSSFFPLQLPSETSEEGRTETSSSTTRYVSRNKLCSSILSGSNREVTLKALLELLRTELRFQDIVALNILERRSLGSCVEIDLVGASSDQRISAAIQRILSTNQESWPAILGKAYKNHCARTYLYTGRQCAPRPSGTAFDFDSVTSLSWNGKML